MNPMLSIKVDVTKISKDRLFKGAKGTYLDATLIPTPNSEYGDYMIVQSVSKEEREQGVKGPIIGNAKVIGSKKSQQQPAQKSSGVKPVDDDPSSVPF